ncbi:MAG: 23S rRNA (guanosine(2251)-2'-O)-methyltransferase RlmB [Rhodospirillaceae bacterium]|jgi:23S rRNA (guanosine2251-2'-O)-methyltransferase|nr:23S rRNA (guanosine(2251)-2'-O)-methyltransferase RlmB [Rhodospirillaceae bacterium]MBT5458081.1 23S rRNA (guanosine(2251)-2'-O)-methyltransferase RlmB [Rhodospirillaceae bacterium]MBT7756616.1 23S rRNA (guanosine(2251)-2'-O)-methyltransferase RlmB [Rhodospirillaceae bacterium]
MRGGNKKRSRSHPPPGNAERNADRHSGRKPAGKAGGKMRTQWLYGRHAVLAALANPERRVTRLVYAGELPAVPGNQDIEPESLTRDDISDLLPPGAVHQGIAAQTAPLPDLSVEEICDRADEAGTALVVLLDQVTDPHNVGAVLRSAAVFGAVAVIVQDRNAPEATGVLAKAASGALESVPLVRAVNIVRALDTLKNAGFWSLGLDSEAPVTIDAIPHTEKRVVVLGSEGAGLRRLTREACDELARIDGGGGLSSLNVSNAAAVALYAVSRNNAAQ